MKKVWKFGLALADRVTVSMPIGSKILSFGFDPQSNFAVWALCDPNTPAKETVTFMIVGTGHASVNDNEIDFVGTVNAGPYMWHCFVLKERIRE
jgi:hypothetical protein